MEEELKSIIKVTAWTAASMTYARFTSSAIKPGIFRLLALLPTILLLPSLPWCFSTIHLRIVSFFSLVWLAIFKLLLLAFGLGPLSPSLPLIPFLATASLPVKLRQNSKKPSSDFTRLIIPCALKVLILAVLLTIYKHDHLLPRFFRLAGYNLHLYLSLDLILSASAFIPGFLVGISLDPQFHVPVISNSLQDFWGRRWNLMVTDILRPSVYYPVRSRWGTDAGIVAAFVVSGFMHEVLYYYIDIAGPRGEAFWFFVLQGLCTAVERKARRRGWWRLHPTMATLFSVGFIMVTASCLLFQPIIRSGADKKAVEETAAVMGLLLGGLRNVVLRMWDILRVKK